MLIMEETFVFGLMMIDLVTSWFLVLINFGKLVMHARLIKNEW